MSGTLEVDGTINSNSGQFGRTVFGTTVTSPDLWTEFKRKPHRYIFSPSSLLSLSLPEITTATTQDLDKARIGHTLFIGNCGTQNIIVDDNDSPPMTIETVKPEEMVVFIAETSPRGWKTFKLAGWENITNNFNITNPTEGEILVATGSPAIYVNQSPAVINIGGGFNTTSSTYDITGSDVTLSTDLNASYQNGPSGNNIQMNATDGTIFLHDNTSTIGSLLIADDGGSPETRYLDINSSYISGMGATTPTGSNTLVIGSGADTGSADHTISLGTSSQATSDYNISIGKSNIAAGTGSAILSPTNSTITNNASGSMILSSLDSAVTLDAGTQNNNILTKIFTTGERFATNADTNGVDNTRANRLTWGANETKSTTGNVTNSTFTTTLELPSDHGVAISATLIGCQTGGGAGSVGDTWVYRYLASAKNPGSPGTLEIANTKNIQGVEVPGKSLNNNDPLVLTASTDAVQFGITTTNLNGSPGEEIQWNLVVEAVYNKFA